MKKVGGTAAVIVLFILLNGTQILSQGRKMDGTIKGIVHESNSDQPVVYANVSLRNIKDSSVVTGDMTDDAGAFEITKVPAGRYYIDIKFLGFATKSLDSIMMFPQRPVLDLGTIYLDPQSYQSEGVEVTAEKEKIEYKLDRKIINITNDVLNAGGSAAEALERTPSVNVDLEGNVSLRGSTEFTVLINGKPSALEGSDALQQIPVSSIEHIEILTNPSAKYDPEGLAGIINVILKEPVLKGFNGMTSLSAGVNDKYDFDINMNFGFNKLNLSAGVNYSKNRYLSEGQMEKTITNENSTIFQSSEELGHRDRNSFNFKLGADYSFARNFSTNFEIGYGGMDFEHKSTGDEITDISDESPIYGISTMIGGRDNNFYNFNWGTNWDINELGQKLSSSVYYSIREGDHTGFNEEVYSDPTFTQKNDYLFGSKDREESEDNELRINIDYILPVTEVTRFEFGYQADMETDDEIFTQEFLDTLTNEYFVSDEYSNEMEFSRNVHAVYGLFVSNVLDFDYQLGLRAEHTDRSVFLPLSNEDYIIDRVDFFPSLNFSRQFEGRHQIIGGYSRRINRPRGHWLEPFPSYRDPYSYRIGNPEIEPEYTDSYEIGYQKYFDKSYISLETYFRHTTNKFERFSEIDEDGLLRYSSRNIGSSDAIGTEVSFNLKPFSWMNFNIVSNVYYYTIESDTLATSAAESDDVTWNLRGFLDFNLTSSLRLQFSSFYNAPEISTQGQREAFFFVDAGLRYDMFERKLSLTLNARNLFDTMGYEATSSGLNFSNYFKFEREARVVQLTISYRFNDFEPERRRGNGGGDMEGDMDF